MKSIIPAGVLLLLHLGLYAQPPKKPVTQNAAMADMQKAMEDAQKELDKLSPEQRALFEQMKKNQLGQPDQGASGSHFVPKKQTVLLSKMRKIGSPDQFSQYLEELLAEAKLNIPATIISQVDDLLAKYKGNALAVHNLPMLLFMQKQVPAAVYAGLLSAKETRNAGTENNLGFLLNQAGYPQYAIPILDYLVQQQSSAILLNNSGQAYLRLGDTTMAYRRFSAAVRLDDNLAEAHSGIAHILLEQKREKEAAVHIAKTLRDGYSEKLGDHVTKSGTRLPFDHLKRKNKADYFSMQKYSPLAPATTLNAALDNWNKITQMDAGIEQWLRKSQELARELPVTDEKWQRRLATSSVRGPYKKKARLMAFLMINNFNEYLASCQPFFAESEQKITEAGRRMNESIEGEYKNNSFKGRYEECQMIQKHIEAYLASTAPIQDNITRRLNPKYFDLVNEELYWLTFFLNSNEYRAEYSNIGHHVAGWQKSLSNVQHLYPDVVNRGALCQDILNNPPEEEELDLVDGKCPVTVKIPLGIGSLKFNCDGWELEGGEGIIVNIEHSYQKGKKDGQWTFAVGPGWEFDIGASKSGVGVMVGAKVQAVFVFDEDFSPADIVIRGEAKEEINAILAQNEAGGKAMISISGTASADALAGNVNDGNEINIFKYNPK